MAYKRIKLTGRCSRESGNSVMKLSLISSLEARKHLIIVLLDSRLHGNDVVVTDSATLEISSAQAVRLVRNWNT